MTAWNALQLDIIDARIRQHLDRVTAMGTVASVDPAALTAQVVIDGSTQAMPVRHPGNLAPTTGDRVGLVKYAGYWIVSFTYNPRLPRGELGAQASDFGTVASSTGSEVAVPAAQWSFAGVAGEPEYTFVAGRMYALHLSGGCYDSAGTVHLATIRVRRGSAAVGGDLLAFVRYQMAPGIGTNVPTFDFTRYVRAAIDVNTKLTLTVQRALGAGSVNLYGDANIPLMVRVTDIGSISANPGLAVVATVI